MTTIAEEFVAATERTNGDVGPVLRRLADLAKRQGQSSDMAALTSQMGGLIGKDPEIDDATLMAALWTMDGGPELIQRILALPMPRKLPTARLAGSIKDPRPKALLSAADTGEGAVLSVGECCLLAGAGGAGKSSLAGEIALAVADDEKEELQNENELLTVHQRGAVLWLTFEEAPAELAHRLQTLAKNTERERAPNQVHVLDCRDGWPLFGPAERLGSAGLYNQRPEKLEAWGAMQTTADDIGDDLALLVIDPVGAAFAGDHSSLAAVREFIGAMSTFVRDREAGSLMLAHSTKSARAKGNPLDPGQVSGTAAWVDGVRGCLVLDYAPEEDDPGDEGLRRLSVFKANLGPSRIYTDAKPRRAEDSEWILGFEAHGRWEKIRNDLGRRERSLSSNETANEGPVW